MNRELLYGIWMRLGGSVTERWGALIGDPLVAAAGRRNRLAGRIEQRRGMLKQQADRELAQFVSRNRHWRDLSRR
jgi:uncharacterized protein YjbJ (UPF0337 family)